jgi:hypothetical protein
MTPEEERVSPEGRAPLKRDQVYGVEPPLAARLVL